MQIYPMLKATLAPYFLVFCVSVALLTTAADTTFAAASVPPAPGMIRVDNNVANTTDMVTVSGLSAGDIIKVYADSGTATVLGSAAVDAGATHVTVTITQLSVKAGYIYVTATQPDYSESRRIVKSYKAEPLSVAPNAASIRVVNHPSGSMDTITVLGLQPGDQIKVYADASRTALLGLATVASGFTGGTVIAIEQLGSIEGVLYIAVIEPGKRESRLTEKAYAGETLSVKPKLAQIRLVNELKGTNDHIIVNGLQSGDMIKVYASERAAVPLTQAIANTESGTADAILSQLGITDGSVYVTITSPPLQESLRVAKQYRPEPITSPPSPSSIVVINEPVGTADRLEMSGLMAGDLVKVYADAASADTIGTVTAGSETTNVMLSIPQLGNGAGHVYVTVTSLERGESRRVVKAYAAEQASTAPNRSNIIIHNAVGSADTITFNGLQSGDRVKVYTDDASTVPLGHAVVAAGAESAVIEAALPETGYGILYMTVTHLQEQESARIAKIYAAEPISLPLTAGQLRVMNAFGSTSTDEITAIAIKPGDIIKVYADPISTTPMQTLLGADAAAAVEAGTTTATITKLQLNESGGLVYVTVTSSGKRESSRTVKAYEAE